MNTEILTDFQICTSVRGTIINKLSQNRRFLISEVAKITFTFASQKCSEGTFLVLKHKKPYFGSSMGINRLHTLILVYVHKNILNNINLADVASEFVDKSRKQTF